MIVAVIPTRYDPPTLAPLLAVLETDGIPVILKRSVAYNHELHVMWNTGVSEARAMGATEIAILNDDITILPGTMQRMAEGLRSCPNAVVSFPDLETGVPRMVERALARIEDRYSVGHCFMLRTDLVLPSFPEKYHLLWGDIDFFEQVRALGYDCVTIPGLVVDHVGSFSVSRVRNEPGPMEDELRRIGAVGSARTWVGRPHARRAFRKRLRALGIPMPEE